MNSIKILGLSIIAAAALSFVCTTARADVLGQHHPGMTKQQPQQPHQPPIHQTQIKHKRVITITTQVRNAQGVERSVNWDITTHLWNPATRQWTAIEWRSTYDRAVQGLNERGWTAFRANSHNARIVTGTW